MLPQCSTSQQHRTVVQWAKLHGAVAMAIGFNALLHQQCDMGTYGGVQVVPVHEDVGPSLDPSWERSVTLVRTLPPGWVEEEEESVGGAVAKGRQRKLP